MFFSLIMICWIITKRKQQNNGCSLGNNSNCNQNGPIIHHYQPENSANTNIEIAPPSYNELMKNQNKY